MCPVMTNLQKKIHVRYSTGNYKFIKEGREQMKSKVILIILLISFIYPVNVFSSDWRVMSRMAGGLHSVWGSSGSDVFAVGDSGRILHYNGSTWSAMTSWTTNNFYGVWGSSGSDAFAVGDEGRILHYNGSDWSAIISWSRNNLRGVWGSSASDVFAVGWNGTILHYNGVTWFPMTSGTTTNLISVWGNSASDVFAVGVLGTILHYDGNKWSSVSSGITSSLRSVWGSSGSDVFAVGNSGTILNYNGIAWSTVINNLSVTTYDLSSSWGSSGSAVFVVGSDFKNGYGIILYNGEIPGGGGCPATTVIGAGNPDLKKLRVFRNDIFLKSEVGRHYICLYYKHALELRYIFINDQELKEKANSIIQKIMPTIEDLLTERDAAISEDTVQEVTELIDALTVQSSPSLEKDLNRLKKDIQSGVIFNTFEVKIQR